MTIFPFYVIFMAKPFSVFIMLTPWFS